MREEGHGCAIATIILLMGIIGMLVLVIFMFREPNFALRDALPYWAKEALFGEGETYETKETKEETKKPVKAESRLKSHTDYYLENEGKVSVEYPIINGMDELEVEEALNNKLRVNAASIVALLPVDVTSDFLNVHCDIIYLNKDKVVVSYKGTYQKGKKTNKTTTNKSSNTTKKSTATTQQTAAAAYDPYLNGYVDPFAALPSYNALGGQTIVPPANGMNITGANVVTVQDGASVVLPNTSDGQVVTNGSVTGPGDLAIDDNGVSKKKKKNTVIERPTAPINGYASTDQNGYTNIFYTNVIDFLTLKDVYLVKTVDTQKLAKYVLSDKVEFENVGTENISKVKSYIKANYTESKLKAQFDKADFRNDKLSEFPNSFSYTLGKTTYVSLKVSAALGDYVLIRYEQ